MYYGTGKGQVAHIKQDATNSGYKNGYLLVDEVWSTGSNTFGGVGVTTSNFFSVKPKSADKIVLVEDTQLWNNGNPALTTAHELLNDAAFESANNSFATEIDGAKTQLQTWSGRPLTFVPVPVLYYKIQTPQGIKATAFTPNLANAQVVGGQFYFPKQWGPIKNGSDLFEGDVAQRVAGSNFTDDWTTYHRHHGEVHCGSATKRGFPAFEWWKLMKP